MVRIMPEPKPKTSDLFPPQYDPMKFGTEDDYSKALTELRFLRKINGSLSEDDFRDVSRKYNFPTGFLKDGLKGLPFPRESVVSTSKWFPIVFAWMAQERELSNDLFRLQIPYSQTLGRYIMMLILFATAGIAIGIALLVGLRLDWLTTSVGFVIPFALAYLSVVLQLRANLSAQKVRIDELKSKMEKAGLGHIVESHDRFLSAYAEDILWVGDIILQKLLTATPMQLINKGSIKMKLPKKESMVEKLEHLAHRRIPNKVEEDIIPVFTGENPYQEYVKRINEIFRQDGIDPDSFSRE
jgi:hypothetical protein